MTDVVLFANLPEATRIDIAAGIDRVLCPACGGGQSREKSLSVRQDSIGILKLRCYRASCEWFAVSVTDRNAVLLSKQMKPPAVYRSPTIPLQGEIRGILRGQYACDISMLNEHGWRLNEHGTELVMSIRSPYGMERGHVTRTFTTPKRCYTFKATAQPWLDWWNCPRATTVIVEDCISAARLASIGYAAVALLGTSMTVDQAKEIAFFTQGHSTVYIALDRDAFDKSVKLARRHAHILKMRPVCLTEDIKNMAYNRDIEALFHG